jgi:hypothetical protein
MTCKPHEVDPVTGRIDCDVCDLHGRFAIIDGIWTFYLDSLSDNIYFVESDDEHK